MPLRVAPPESDCTDCCDCPPPIMQVQSRAISPSYIRCGYPEFVPSEAPKVYLRDSWSGTLSFTYKRRYCVPFDECEVGTMSFLHEWEERRRADDEPLIRDPLTCSDSGVPRPEWRERTGQITSYDPCEFTLGEWSEWGAGTFVQFLPDACISRVYTPTTITVTLLPCYSAPCSGREDSIESSASGSIVMTRSEEFTDEIVLNKLLDLLESQSYGEWQTIELTELAYLDISEDGQSGVALESKFKFRHKVPKIGTGCYIIRYDMVTIPKSIGPGVQSLEFEDPVGGYVPDSEHAVEISGPNVGRRTGFYRQATATATANSLGQLVVTLGDGGAGYGPGVTASVDGHPLIVHLEGSGQMMYQYSGPPPAGYDPEDPDTYPESNVRFADLPEAAEEPLTVVIMNLRARCRGCL